MEARLPIPTHSRAALAEARQIVLDAGRFMDRYPEDGEGLRTTAWAMLKDDFTARRQARILTLRTRATPGDAA